MPYEYVGKSAATHQAADELFHEVFRGVGNQYKKLRAAQRARSVPRNMVRGGIAGGVAGASTVLVINHRNSGRRGPLQPTKINKASYPYQGFGSIRSDDPVFHRNTRSDARPTSMRATQTERDEMFRANRDAGGVGPRAHGIADPPFKASTTPIAPMETRLARSSRLKGTLKRVRLSKGWKSNLASAAGGAAVVEVGHRLNDRRYHPQRRSDAWAKDLGERVRNLPRGAPIGPRTLAGSDKHDPYSSTYEGAPAGFRDRRHGKHEVDPVRSLNYMQYGRKDSKHPRRKVRKNQPSYGQATTVGKADRRGDPAYDSTGRRVLASAFPGVHGTVAGRKGKKIRAAANQGLPAAAAVGATSLGVLELARRGKFVPGMGLVPTVAGWGAAHAGYRRNLKRDYLKPVEKRARYHDPEDARQRRYGGAAAAAGLGGALLLHRGIKGVKQSTQLARRGVRFAPTSGQPAAIIEVEGKGKRVIPVPQEVMRRAGDLEHGISATRRDLAYLGGGAASLAAAGGLAGRAHDRANRRWR